jgi:hypothetical protein
MATNAKPVTKLEVEAALRPIEPDYHAIANLGPSIIPILDEIVTSGDQLLAPRAVWAAAALVEETKEETEIAAIAKLIDQGSRSKDVLLRIAAGGANHALPPKAGGMIAARLLNDSDVGVRKTALEGVPRALSPALVAKVETIAEHDKQPELREMAATLLKQHPKAEPPTE